MGTKRDVRKLGISRNEEAWEESVHVWGSHLYGVDVWLMEMVDGKFKATTALSKGPERTKVNPARGKDCRGHITLTLAAKAGPSGVPNPVFGASSG